MSEKTLELIFPSDPIRQRWLPIEIAVREVVSFERRFGKAHFRLACHAALPMVITSDLINLIHINFLDGENVSWIAGVDFLLSPLCHPVDEIYGYYEVEPRVREVLLVELECLFGRERKLELSDFLLTYLHKRLERKQQEDVAKIHYLIAQAYIDPDCTLKKVESLLFESVSGENDWVSLSKQIQIVKAIQFLEEPFQHVSERSQYKSLVVNAHLLAQVIYGNKQEMRQRLQNRWDEIVGMDGIAPAILNHLAQSISETTSSLSVPGYSVFVYHPATQELVGAGFIFSDCGQVITTAQVMRAAGVDLYDTNSQDVIIRFSHISDSERAASYATVLAYFPKGRDGLVLLQRRGVAITIDQKQIGLVAMAESAFGHEVLVGNTEAEIIENKDGFLKLRVHSAHIASQNINGTAVFDSESKRVVGLVSDRPNFIVEFDNTEIMWAVDCSILNATLFDLSCLTAILE